MCKVVILVIVALLGLIRPVEASLRASKKPNPSPYLIGRGDVFANASANGHTFVFRKDTNFPRSHNKLVVHSFLNLGFGNKWSVCDQFTLRLLTEDIASWGGNLVDVLPLPENQVGLVNSRNQIETLTKLDSNPNECFKDMVPDSTWNIVAPWDWFDPSLTLLPNNEAVMGKYYVNSPPYNYNSAIYSTITGELLRSEYISDGIPYTQFTDVEAFDGNKYWLSCNCGNNKELRSSSGGLSIMSSYSVNFVGASSLASQIIVAYPVGQSLDMEVYSTETGAFVKSIHADIPAKNFFSCRGFSVSADMKTAYLLGAVQVLKQMITILVTVDLTDPQKVTVTPISEDLAPCSDIAIIDDHHLAVWEGYNGRKYHVFSI